MENGNEIRKSAWVTVTQCVGRGLISMFFYERSTLINLDFLIEKNFWYVVTILDFTYLRMHS